MTPSIGFIGGGRVARILLHGWKSAEMLPESILVSDRNEEVLNRIAGEFPEIRTAGDDIARVAVQDVIFLAVHPPDAAAALEDLRGSLDRNAILVSLAPVVTIARIADMLGGFARIARVIPNAPSVVHCGYNPVVFSPSLEPKDRAVLGTLLEPLGDFFEVAEADLEAYAVITAMGPTCLWPQLYELETITGSFGLSPERAAQAVRKMAEGAVKTMAYADLSSDEIMDLIPVRPLGDDESTIREIYRTRLPALYRKLKG
ncbi:MAG: NAD(P)-binding domain-containing protein [Methanomicrobiaceae archaeon]|nr:NAD(P)-binding domain-containing protein [Methanomicrobiaceae archaeon]